MQAGSLYSLSVAMSIFQALALLLRKFFTYLLVLSPVLTGFAQSGNNSGVHSRPYYFQQFTVDDGLSQNNITSIHQDRKGFIWVGTRDGLNKFDGFKWRVFKFDPTDENSLSDSYVTAIYEDQYHRLWVGTYNGGLHYFDRRNLNFVRFPHDPENENSISSNQIRSLISDRNGALWVGTNGGGLNKLIFNGMADVPDEIKVVRFDGPVNGFPEPDASVHTLFFDSNRQLWIGTGKNIFLLNTANRFASFINIAIDTSAITNAQGSDGSVAGARSIFEDNYGGIWMGNSYGLFILDAENSLFINYKSFLKHFTGPGVLSATLFYNRDREEIWIVSENSIYVLDPLTEEYSKITFENQPGGGMQKGGFNTLYADNGGGIWIGSNGQGLSLYSPGTIKFVHARDTLPAGTGKPLSSRDLSIRGFYQGPDDHNILWIGAEDGLYKVSRESSVMTRIKLYDTRGDEISGVSGIAGDENGLIWLGTGSGLVRFNPGDNSSRFFPAGMSPEEPGGMAVTCVHVSNGNIWVLTPNTIASLNQETGDFSHTVFNGEPRDNYRIGFFPYLHQERNGNFWIAADNGLHYLDVSRGDINSYETNPSDPHSWFLNHINVIMDDPFLPDDYLWLGTAGNGIIRFDKNNAGIDAYTEKQGLSNNMVYGMLYDDAGAFWISTNRGLSKFKIDQQDFTSYSRVDGLQGNEFSNGAYYKSLLGEMFFGGINGYNSFYPSEIVPRNFQAPMVFTGFRILNENVADKFPDLEVNEEAQVKLSYTQNSFIIEFASLDFANPLNNSYSYSMTTSGENWIHTGHNRSVVFTDLKPGVYTMKVRGTNSDGIWSDREALMIITIASPWWHKTWVYFIYLTVFIGIIISLRRYELSRIRLKEKIRMANIETIKLKELDHLKSQFFANISHEFRTPLTLIKGPLEQLRAEEDDQHKRKLLEMTFLNASRLLQLVNQLLDLSRIESGNYNVNPVRGDIVGLVKGISNSFASLALHKSISLKTEVSPALETERLNENFYYDPDILEKILNNLLSNAVKFTPENGTIYMGVQMNKAHDQKEWLEIVVEDTGIGIPAGKLPYIYDRFFQVDASSRREFDGIGIGLAYVKELIHIHGAEISVRSMPATGTAFTMRFPTGKDHFPSGRVILDVPEPVQQQPGHSLDPLQVNNEIEHGGEVADNSAAPWVLIVDDHQDVRHYIAESLQRDYRVMEAASAREGFSIAGDMIPDIIISDIMMPEIDGYEFCKMIKTSEKTSHIPVILLTARADEADRITGLETGADDYLTKPFNVRELKARVKNIIESQRVMRERFFSGSVIKPNEISVNSRDAVFMEKLLRVVEKNIDNNAFSVEDLGREAGMSPSQIHRKLKSTVNMPANHFIRSVRMHRAMQFLQNNSGNIAEIAYMVGYDDPGYFTKTFRAFFGKLPSDVVRKRIS
jgi:signal transduction histidine kinase/ligand-binding sensor domain-containing protein/DNA-binding response OmpR family regulator